MIETVHQDKVDDDYGEFERLSNTKDEQCKLCEFFQKRKEEGNNISGDISARQEFLDYFDKMTPGKSIFENRYKVTSFYINLKEKKWYFSTCSRVLNWPIKW